MGTQQSHQMGEEIKEGKCADHNQKASSSLCAATK